MFKTAENIEKNRYSAADSWKVAKTLKVATIGHVGHVQGPAPSEPTGGSGQIVRRNIAAELAAKHGVSERTIRRDAKFAEAVDLLGLQADVIGGRLRAPMCDVIAAARAVRAGRLDLGDAVETLRGLPARRSTPTMQPPGLDALLRAWRAASDDRGPAGSKPGQKFDCDPAGAEGRMRARGDVWQA